MKVVVFGATGYAGGYVVQELVARGHQVVAVSRTGVPAAVPAGAGAGSRAGAAAVGAGGAVTLTGSVHDAAVVAAATEGADAIVAALPAGGGAGEELADAVAVLLEAARTTGARLVVVGGAGSLPMVPGGAPLAEDPGFPPFLLPVVAAHGRALERLRAADGGMDWTYLSPAAGFGPQAPGRRTGAYRTSVDALVTDAQGQSQISGADYAIALVDEVERPAHSRQQFTVGY